MADRYQTLTGTPVGKLVVDRLGLPNPRPLRRYRAGETPLSGTFLLGGDGRAGEPCRLAVIGGGGDVATEHAEAARYAGLVFDATTVAHSENLVALPRFFTPVLRALADCPHIVVIGRLPADAETRSASIAQRSIEGFTRSLGKEIGRGGTVQLVYVGTGCRGQDRLHGRPSSSPPSRRTSPVRWSACPPASQPRRSRLIPYGR